VSCSTPEPFECAPAPEPGSLHAAPRVIMISAALDRRGMLAWTTRMLSPDLRPSLNPSLKFLASIPRRRWPSRCLPAETESTRVYVLPIGPPLSRDRPPMLSSLSAGPEERRQMIASPRWGLIGLNPLIIEVLPGVTLKWPLGVHPTT